MTAFQTISRIIIIIIIHHLFSRSPRLNLQAPRLRHRAECALVCRTRSKQLTDLMNVSRTHALMQTIEGGINR